MVVPVPVKQIQATLKSLYISRILQIIIHNQIHNMYIPGMPSLPNGCLRNQEKCDNFNTDMSHEMCIWFVFVVVVVLAPSNSDVFFYPNLSGLLYLYGEAIA